MAKTIHERFRKWNSSKNRMSQQAVEFSKLVLEDKANYSVWDLLEAFSAERERAFEAGYMSALKHMGGKKK